jgi:hypothetical protein
MNLVGDTVVITDITQIESIRKLIKHRSIGTWNRPIAKWRVRMILHLSNLETLDLVITKIKNDKDHDMTHLYFGSGRCHDDFPGVSRILGKQLEILTNFIGQLY